MPHRKGDSKESPFCFGFTISLPLLRYLIMARILVVDDEQDLREILRFNLETEGFEVETAASAEEALAIFNFQFSI